MAGKYEKPIARNLGEFYPEAIGLCTNGSTVIPRTVGNCKSGTSPAGGTKCESGGTAGAASCNPGLSAGNCTNGQTASL
jgi:hypothetical protein